MIKRILSLSLLAFVFVGCGITIDKTDILKSNKYCKDKLGFKHIKATPSTRAIVECLDGSRTFIDEIKLKDTND